jgi:hypothetical protein
MTQDPPLLTLEQDIPCMECGYNLRGLDSSGRCPECGKSAAASVHHWMEQTPDPPLIESGAAWIRGVAEGLCLALLSFTLMIALACAPDWAFASKSPQRQWTLGTAIVAWVLSSLAAWKVAAPDRAGHCVVDGTRRTLRIAPVFYLLSLVFLGLMPRENRRFVEMLGVMSMVVSGIAAACTWFAYLSRLAARAGARMIAAAALVLVVANALVFLASLLPELDGSPDSVTGMFKLHFIPFGSIELLRELRLSIQQGMVPHWLLLLGAVVPILSAAITFRLLCRLRAVLGEKTPASSPP